MKLNSVLAIILVMFMASAAFADDVTNLDSLTLSNDLVVGDDATVSGDLTVTGDINASTDIAITTDLDVGGALDVTGALSVGSYVATKHLWFPATAFKLPSSAPATAGEEDSIGTLVFVDSSADVNAWLTFIAPDDMDTSKTMEVQVYYILPSGTPGAGTWNFTAIGLDDDEAGSAAATELTTITDTPSAAGDWNLTTGTSTIPTSVTTKDIINLVMYHDVAEQFGGTVEVAGVKISYTSNKP